MSLITNRSEWTILKVHKMLIKNFDKIVQFTNILIYINLSIELSLSMTLQFDGCAFFRQRLVLSTLSFQPIKIKNIRSQENEPGLRGNQTLMKHSKI